jgi:hypothetical protein
METKQILYAVTFFAAKPDGKGNFGTACGLQIITESDDESAQRAALQLGVDKFKPKDGYVGHIAGAIRVFSEEAK